MPREQERTPVSLDILLEWSSGRREARVSDLSLGGCFIDCIASIREGEIVSFKVKISDGQWFEMSGEVVYVLAGFGFGIRFTDLTENRLILLEHLILMNDGDPWARPETLSAPAPAPMFPSGGRVLLADDDPQVQDLSAAALRQEGLTVVGVRDTREAYYRLLSDADFTAAIFDAELPSLQAFNVVRYMKMETRLRSIPVGIITEKDDPKLRQHSFSAGAEIFLRKPFTPQQMNEGLRQLLGRNRG
jgi:CheY-like chemotaxis protein